MMNKMMMKRKNEGTLSSSSGISKKGKLGDAEMVDIEPPLLAFQKKAIWKQMKWYKRLALKLEDESSTFEKSLKDYKLANEWVVSSIKQIYAICEDMKESSSLNSSGEIEDIKAAFVSLVEKLILNFKSNSSEDEKVDKVVEIIKKHQSGFVDKISTYESELRVLRDEAVQLKKQIGVLSDELSRAERKNDSVICDKGFGEQKECVDIVEDGEISKVSSTSKLDQKDVEELNDMLSQRLEEIKSLQLEKAELSKKLLESINKDYLENRNEDIVQSPMFSNYQSQISNLKEKVEYLSRRIRDVEQERDDQLQKRKALAAHLSDELSIKHKETTEVISHLKSSIDELQNQIVSLRAGLNERDNQIVSWKEREMEWEILINSVKEKLRAHEERIQYLAKKSDVIDSIKSNVAAEDALEKMESLMQEGESELISEIETIGKAFDQLQEQNNRLIKQIEEKDDIVSKLLSEKMKNDLVQSQLLKEKESINSYINNLKETEITLGDRIRTLEQREAKLNHQLVSLEKDIASKATMYDSCRRKLMDAAHSNQELMRHLQEANDKKLELQTQTKSLIDEVQTLKFDNSRISEDCRILRKRLGLSNNEILPRENFDELDAYKKLLYCNSCELRQKSVILTRCMHLFCKECIDARIETRQRKCPNCGDAFGVNDVKMVYL